MSMFGLVLHCQHLKCSLLRPRFDPFYKTDSLPLFSLMFFLLAVLNVDNSVVDLETIEALYENVSRFVIISRVKVLKELD